MSYLRLKVSAYYQTNWWILISRHSDIWGHERLFSNITSGVIFENNKNHHNIKELSTAMTLWADTTIMNMYAVNYTSSKIDQQLTELHRENRTVVWTFNTPRSGTRADKNNQQCVPKQILANYESDNGLNRPTALNTWGVYLEIKLCLPFIQKTPTQRGRE